MEIVKKYEDGIMCILPSDQFVKNTEEFTKVMDAAILAAEETDMLVTIGIEPTFPATGYGYICTEKSSAAKIGETGKEYRMVKEFVEKPDEETAKEYLASGNYAWNSGMFIWKASTILKKFETLLPDIYACLVKIGEAMGTSDEKHVIEEIYPEIPKISIDYGIMEHSTDVLMIAGDFGWNDIGSLDMLGIMKPENEDGNVCYGEQINVDTKNCILYGKDKLIATIGVENLIVIQEKDAILICDKNRAQDVKNVVDRLGEEGKEKYL